MQEYDVTLKLLLAEAAERTLRLLGAPGPVSRWLNVELPKVQNRRVDLLAELVSGKLLQIELQATNITDLPVRMLEYGAGTWRVQGSFPKQIVLYVGNDRVRMPNGHSAEGLEYQYDLVDIRDLDGEVLLDSESTADNILAVLTEIPDKGATIRRIITKISRLEHGRREDALRKLLILCGMRGLTKLCQEERKKMPVDLDIMDDEVLGPLIRQGQEEGRERGREEGRAEGQAEGRAEGREQTAKVIVRRMIEKRFGRIPAWADQLLTASSPSTAEDLAIKILDAATLEELFS